MTTKGPILELDDGATMPALGLGVGATESSPGRAAASVESALAAGYRTCATVALDTGLPPRDLEDSTGHKGFRITRLYDRSRTNLDRNATYAVASD